MVKIHLSQEWFCPGDELRVALLATPNEGIQLLSVRCLGYVRLPANVIKEMPDREKYTFHDKPIGPELPTDSFLLWYSPNYPVHIDDTGKACGLVKMFVPFFLPPSIRGGLFEISHFVEIAVLKKGEMDLRMKRLPLHISGVVSDMPKRFYPTVGDGYDQFDFSVRPTFQSTPHGSEASAWEAEYINTCNKKPVSSSLIFRSKRTFKISFNGKHATEIGVFGEWSARDHLMLDTGNVCQVVFRFENPEVSVKRIKASLIRTESITGRSEVFESHLWTSPSPISVTQHIIETLAEIPVPLVACPSFSSELLAVDYRIEFELRAIDSALTLLEPVVWALPVDVRLSNRDSDVLGLSILPAQPFGTVKSLVSQWNNLSTVGLPPSQSQEECEIDQVVIGSCLYQPGAMKFTVHS